MTITPTSYDSDAVRILQDWTAVYAEAVGADDPGRAATALATIQQAAHIAGLGLPERVAALTHSNGVYKPPTTTTYDDGGAA